MMQDVFYWAMILMTAFCLGVISWKSWKSKKDEREQVADKKNVGATTDGMAQHELMETMLKEIGCQPVWEEGNKDLLTFSYQGENFNIDVQNGHKFITITDAWWHQAPLDDIEQFALIRQAINECNINCPAATIIYTINNEHRVIGVHTRQHVLFTSDIPDAKDYLRSRLEVSFLQHRNFFQKMDELRRTHAPETK